MTDRDTSSVFHRDMLDDEFRDLFVHDDPERPWIFETEEDGAARLCVTEDEACALQRAYRISRGFDPITGERA